jgi:putative ABC transport system permease protein
MFTALRSAWSAVVRHKLRSALTILGIFIGTASVVLVVALSTGASAQVSGQVDALGTNVLFVFPQPSQSSGVRGKSIGRLTESDAFAIARDAPAVKLTAPYLETRGQVLAEKKNAQTVIIGSTLNYFDIRGFAVARGDLWTELDERLKARVILLGPTVATNLFGDDDPVGRSVRIGRNSFRVIGLLARRGTSPFGEDEDDRVMLPIGTFRGRVQPTSPGRVDFILASATTPEATDRASKQVSEIIRQRHRIPDDRDNDFVVRTQAEFKEKQEAITSMLSMLLLGVAGVSLVVGGIGVMNVMLVSVAERIAEIGLRLAVGAPRAAIRNQFLLEALLLALLGGVFGLAAGSGLVFALAKALAWPTTITGSMVAMALGTSSVVGVAFGYWPAHSASNLDPITALRRES